MESPPTLEEIWEALSSMDSRIAAGKNVVYYLSC